MFRRLPFWITFGLLLCLAPAVTIAQSNAAACPDIVERVLTTVGDVCGGAGRNQACYGNVAIDLQARDGAGDVRFEQVGDIIDVSQVRTLRLSGMREDVDTWGVALLKLQANIPDMVPGQNVTFLLFGDVQITDAVPPGEGPPMQAFYLTTGTSAPLCAEAPQDGLMVRTPEGMGEVAFAVNGVDVSMGSTVFFQAQQSGQMRVTTLNGTAALRNDGRVTPIIAGTRGTFELDERLRPVGDFTVESYADDLDFDPTDLPYDAFGPDFEVLFEDDEDVEPLFSTGLSDDELDAFLEQWEREGTACGDLDFLPDCDDTIESLGGALASFDDDDDFDFDWDDDGFDDFIDGFDFDNTDFDEDFSDDDFNDEDFDEDFSDDDFEGEDFGDGFGDDDFEDDDFDEDFDEDFSDDDFEDDFDDEDFEDDSDD